MQLWHFRTVTPVWIHWWLWNDAQSLKQHRRGSLFIFSCDQAALWMVFSLRLKKDGLIERVKSLTKNLLWKHYTIDYHHWRNVKETSLDHNQTGPKTSPESPRRIIINILGILELPDYYLSFLLGILECCYLLLKQADVQLDEVTLVAGGLTLHSCYCN